MTKISLMTAATELDGTEMVEIIQDGVNKKVPVNLLVIAGKSAYQLAVDAGYVGTMEDWLLSLQGEPGENGQPGIQGLQGQQGVPGTAGASNEVLVAELVSGDNDGTYQENNWNVNVILPSLDVRYDQALLRFMFIVPGIYELNLVGQVDSVNMYGEVAEWQPGISTLDVRIRAGYVATVPPNANSRFHTRQTDDANKNFPLGFSERFYLNVKDPISTYEGLAAYSVMISEPLQNNYRTKMGLTIKRIGDAYYAPLLTYHFAEPFGDYPTEYSTIEEAKETYRIALENNSQTPVFVNIGSTDLTVPGEYYTVVYNVYVMATGQLQDEVTVQINITSVSTAPVPVA